MVTSINNSGITVGSDGKISISGVSSGIDSKALIDAAIKAKRVPAVKLEAKISLNNDKIASFKELKTLTSSLTTALDKLRGSTSFLSDNVFKNKAVSGSSAAAAGAPSGHIPSDVGDLLTVSVEKNAQVANHTIKINSLAKAHQLRSDATTSTTSAVSTLGVTTGDFTINGTTITVDADDTLIDVRAKINDAGAGVTATIVSANATTHYLVLSSTQTGTANDIDFGAGTATSDTLGLTNAGAVKNPLVAAQDANIDVDGVTGIVRSSNTIDDVIEGVTLSLLKAETDTEVTLKVEPDLVSIKSAVTDLVTAYNDIRTFYDDERTALDRNDDGQVDDGEFGVLASDNTLRQIIDKLGQLAAFSNDGNTDGYRSLGQVGVVVGSDYKLAIDNSIFDNKLLTNVDGLRRLFAFDFSSNDSRVSYLGRTDNTQPGTYYLNVAGTDASGNILSANLQTGAGLGSGGAADGSLTPSGKQVTATNTTDAYGLNLFFNGAASLGPVDDIQLTFSRGAADMFYDFFEQLTKTSGGFDTTVLDLTSNNETYQDNIELIDIRLETVRTTLEAKYTAMEVALARLEQVKSAISSYSDAANKSSG